MRKQWYRANDEQTFEGHKTIKLKEKDNEELEINSKYGFIWKYSDTHYKACITNHRIANKLNPLCGAKTGDECVFLFPASELEYYIKALKIKKNRVAMINRANNFGRG